MTKLEKQLLKKYFNLPAKPSGNKLRKCVCCGGVFNSILMRMDGTVGQEEVARRGIHDRDQCTACEQTSFKPTD